MKRKLALAENLHGGSVGALGAAFLGAFLLLSPFGHGLVHLSYDIPFALRSDIRADEAVIVYMDEESRRQLKQTPEGPWDRSLHVQLLKELTARRAKAVVFDVLFDQASDDTAIDEALASAIKNHGRVVLAASSQRMAAEDKPSLTKVTRAVEPIGSAALWGVIELPLEADGAIRRQYIDPNYTNLAWQTAALVNQTPGNRLQPRWLNYYAAQGAIPRVSYYEVLETNALSAEFFLGKIVFVGIGSIIGYRSSKGVDEYPTPYSRWTGFNTPGVEIHATAFLNLIRRDWLTRFPAWAELCLVVLLGLGAGFGLSFLRPVPAAVAASLSVICFSFFANLLVWKAHHWFSWAIIPGVQVPVAFAWAILYRMRQRPAKRTGRERACEDIPPVPDHALLRCIGEGSYGEVWLARNVMGTYRAVKIVYRKHFESDSPFDREFTGIKNFEPLSRSYEGFVDILHVGRNDTTGFFYYVMEIADDLILGQQINPDNYTPKTLGKELAKRERLPVSECLAIGLCLTEALHRLHEKGLVHRDIKPANIVYVAAIPKLADIGLVAEIREAKSYVGTEGFIPPEGPGTPQADIYSLGKVLYEITMGRDRRHFPELPTGTLSLGPKNARGLRASPPQVRTRQH